MEPRAAHPNTALCYSRGTRAPTTDSRGPIHAWQRPILGPWWPYSRTVVALFSDRGGPILGPQRS
eukprot:scaffold19750_cov101-Isochrysis_galbana.AAC.1